MFERLERFQKGARDSIVYKKRTGNWESSVEKLIDERQVEASPHPSIFSQSMLEEKKNPIMNKIVHHIKQLRMIVNEKEKKKAFEDKKEAGLTYNKKFGGELSNLNNSSSLADNELNQNLKLFCWNCGKLNHIWQMQNNLSNGSGRNLNSETLLSNKMSLDVSKNSVFSIDGTPLQVQKANFNKLSKFVNTQTGGSKRLSANLHDSNTKRRNSRKGSLCSTQSFMDSKIGTKDIEDKQETNINEQKDDFEYYLVKQSPIKTTDKSTENHTDLKNRDLKFNKEDELQLKIKDLRKDGKK